MFQSASAQNNSFDFDMRNKVELQKAETADVKIHQLAGELNLVSQTMTQLMRGEYLYNDPQLGKPVTDYWIADKKGLLEIKNTDFEDLHLNIDTDDEGICVWNIQLNKSIPTDVNIKMGAGESNVNLEGAKITKFNYSVKAGSVTINLRNTSVPYVKCKAIASEATIDLTGEWNNDLHGHFIGGVGNLYLILPEGYNLQVEVNGILGDIDTADLVKKGDYWVKEIDQRKPTLYIDITGGIGNITLARE